MLAEINGCHLTGPEAGKPLSGATPRCAPTDPPPAAAGSTPGVYADGVNQAARRSARAASRRPASRSGAGPGPPNRRILYNRASADPDGKPWSERKTLRLVGRATQGRWVGDDVPDFPVDRAPRVRPDPDVGGPDGAGRRRPVHHAGRRQGLAVRAQGHGRRAAADALRAAGVPGRQRALPAAAEPGASHVPAQGQPERAERRRARAPTSIPYVFTTYRLTEHHTAGGMSRWLPYLAELQPEMFCEVSPELAAERGLEPYGWATIVSPAGGDRGQGAGHRADDARCHRRPHRPPDRAALSLGRRQRRGGQRRRGQRPARRDPGPERADPGVQGGLLRHPSGPPAPGRGRCCGWSQEYQSPRGRRPSSTGQLSRQVTESAEPIGRS